MPIVPTLTPSVHPVLPKPRCIPYARMTQARALLQLHQHTLQTVGEAAYIIHRPELKGRPYNFLQAIRRVVGPHGSAAWWQPWRRGVQSNVLIVTLVGWKTAA